MEEEPIQSKVGATFGSTSASLPFLGAGVEWDPSSEASLLNRLKHLDVIELVPECFFSGRWSDFLRELGQAGTPVIIHATNFSLASVEPFEESYFESVAQVADAVNTVCWSDHLALKKVGGVDLGALTPIPWNASSLACVTRNVRAIQQRISCPFLVENIAYPYVFPGNEWTEQEFLSQLTDQTGCGFILDVTNLYTNSINFGFNASEWLESFPISAVQAVHLTGGRYDAAGFLTDSHDQSVPEPVWALFGSVCRKKVPSASIIETLPREPDPEMVDRDLARARDIVEKERNYGELGLPTSPSQSGAHPFGWNSGE